MGTAESQIKYKTLLAHVKNIICKAKRDHALRLFEGCTDYRVLWRKIESFGVGGATDSILSLTFNPDDFNKHFLQTSLNHISLPLPAISEDFDTSAGFNFRLVDETEVVIAFRSIFTNVSSDVIPLKFVKNLDPVIFPYLSFLINNSITSSVFP